MIALHDGELYETAKDRMMSNGFILSSLTWDEDSIKMEINYDYNGLPINLNVCGLPTDIPPKIFDGLLDHFIKSELKGQKKLALNVEVLAYLRRIKNEKKVKE